MTLKRWVAMLAVLAALIALPAVALGLARVLHGPAGPGPNAIVDVQFNFKKGHAKKITRFEFANIPASCKGYPATAVSDTFPHHITVSKGKFSSTQKANGGLATYIVSGHFINLHSAAGKLHIKGTVPGCRTADTGVVHWSATG